MTSWKPPQYLAVPETEGRHLFGSLSYDDDEKAWIIDGEPAVAELAKRLFPGSMGLGAGKARFPATKRAAGDLNWLMLRFPLSIGADSCEAWEKARLDAIRHAEVRVRVNLDRPHLPASEGFSGKLLPFQEEGLAYLLNNERCLLADEMGTGKTPTALAWIHARGASPALIVAPPHLLSQWGREISRFLPGVPFSVLRGRKPRPVATAPIYLTHYLLLEAWREELLRMAPPVVVFDEVQDLRHNGTKKYSAASLISEKAEHVAGLSGTPIYNRGGEIWNVLNILEYHCLGDWEAFTREWCEGYRSDVVSHPDVLGDYLRREGLMLRRTKADVLADLPPKRRVVQHIDSDQGKFSSLMGTAVQLALQVGSVKDPFQRGRMVREAVNQTRRATGVAKAPFVAAFVRSLLEAGEKVLLFAYHHDVWGAYGEALEEFRPSRITGMETQAQKDAAVASFMGSGRRSETDLCMVSLRAASGLNLQRATCVVFGELDWSPAVHSQAEDRAHRIGQKDSLLCYYLTCDEGTDEEMLEALGLKVSQFLGIMGDRSETEEDRALAQTVATEHLNRVIAKLRARSTGTTAFFPAETSVIAPGLTPVGTRLEDFA